MKKAEIVKIANQMKDQFIQTPYGPSLINGAVVIDGKQLVELAEFGTEIYHLSLEDFAGLLKGVLVEVDKMEGKAMQKFNAIYKRGKVEKAVIVEVYENDQYVVIEGSKRKDVKKDTIRRWYEIGEEIVEVKKEKKAKKKAAAKKAKVSKEEKVQKAQRPAEERIVKQDGTVREDKFRSKLDVEQVIEIRAKYKEGAKKSHLAKEYGVSFRTITCIVERLMWKHVA